MIQNAAAALCLLAFLCGAALFVCPEGGGKRVLSVLCTAVLFSAILALVNGFDLDRYTLYEAQTQAAQAQVLQNGRAGEALLRKLALKGSCEDYLLRKAETLGLRDPQIQVEIRDGENGTPCPYAVTLCAKLPDPAEVELRAIIRNDLGIPDERQAWLPYG